MSFSSLRNNFNRSQLNSKGHDMPNIQKGLIDNKCASDLQILKNANEVCEHHNSSSIFIKKPCAGNNVSRCKLSKAPSMMGMKTQFPQKNGLYNYISETPVLYPVDEYEDSILITKSPENHGNTLEAINKKLNIRAGNGLIIKVRLLYGDNEINTKIEFNDKSITVSEVCEIIRVKKLNMTRTDASLFSLWAMGKDFEFQLPNEMRLDGLMKVWPKLNVYYSHCYTSNKKNSDNFIILYRRCAIVSHIAEQNLRSPKVTDLLYGECKFNVINGRYPCQEEDAVFLGALIVFSYLGEYNPNVHTTGYLSSGLYKYVVPRTIVRSLTPNKWEHKIMKQHMKFSNISVHQARHLFVSHVRRWNCYGSSYFPICMDKPMLGFFELRSQIWYIGINVRGLFIFDIYNHSHIFDVRWKNIIRIRYSKDTVEIGFFIYKNKRNAFEKKKIKKNKIIRIISPQSPIIYNLATKCRVIHILETLHLNGSKNPEIKKQISYLPNPTNINDNMDAISMAEVPYNDVYLPPNFHTKHIHNAPSYSSSHRKVSNVKQKNTDHKSKVLSIANRLTMLYHRKKKSDISLDKFNTSINTLTSSYTVAQETSISDANLYYNTVVVPCKQKGPIKKLKNDSKKMYTSNFSSPSAIFSKQADDDTIII